VLGNRVREFRERRREGLRPVATAAGMALSHLSKLERGLASCGDETKLRLAEHFGVSVAELFFQQEREPVGSINVAIIGAGNCASSLIQGVHFYRDAQPGQEIPGLMHVDLGGYHIRDINFVAAFDVDVNKVAKDLS